MEKIIAFPKERIWNLHSEFRSNTNIFKITMQKADFMKNSNWVLRNWAGVLFIFIAIPGIAVTWVHIHEKGFSPKTEFDFIRIGIGLLSVILIAVALEKIEVRENIINKIKSIDDNYKGLLKSTIANNDALVEYMESLKQKPEYELIEGPTEITRKAKEAIEQASEEILATSFHSSGEFDLKNEYYHVLANKIKNSSIHYYCAYDEDHDFTNRRDEFKNIGLSDVEYNRMHFYKCSNNKQKYNKEKEYKVNINFLIIDEKVLFMAFPKFGDHSEMNLMIRVDHKSSNENRKLISSLAKWYDNNFKHDDFKKDTKDVLGISKK